MSAVIIVNISQNSRLCALNNLLQLTPQTVPRIQNELTPTLSQALT